MNKYLILILGLLGLTSCTVKDERYYQRHPQALQQAVKLCPNQHPNGMSCQQLMEIANRLNVLGYQLQYNPQRFGIKILSLQQTLADQHNELKKNNSDSQLKDGIDQNKRELADLLAVVKWLESPEG